MNLEILQLSQLVVSQFPPHEKKIPECRRVRAQEGPWLHGYELLHRGMYFSRDSHIIIIVN